MIELFSNLEHFDDGSDPWCDLIFEVREVKRAWFSDRTTIRFAAQVFGTPVGFSAAISKRDWKCVRAQDDDSVPFWWGKVKLYSCGQESDHLVNAMQAYCNLEIGGNFPREIECQAVSLEGNPTDLNSARLRTKLFFDDGSEVEDRYAELFFHIDLPAKRGALNEKDPDYREPLMDWLSGSFGSTLQ